MNGLTMDQTPEEADRIRGLEYRGETYESYRREADSKYTNLEVRKMETICEKIARELKEKLFESRNPPLYGTPNSEIAAIFREMKEQRLTEEELRSDNLYELFERAKKMEKLDKLDKAGISYLGDLTSEEEERRRADKIRRMRSYLGLGNLTREEEDSKYANFEEEERREAEYKPNMESGI